LADSTSSIDNTQRSSDDRPNWVRKALDQLASRGMGGGSFRAKFKRNPRIVKVYGDPNHPTGFIPAIDIDKCPCGLSPAPYICTTTNSQDLVSNSEFRCRNCGMTTTLNVPEEEESVRGVSDPRNIEVLRSGDARAVIPNREFKIGEGRQLASWRSWHYEAIDECKRLYEQEGKGLRDLANYLNSVDALARANKTNVDVMVRQKGWIKGRKKS